MPTELAFLAFEQRLESSLDSCLRARDASGAATRQLRLRAVGGLRRETVNVPVEERLGLGVPVTLAAHSQCKGDSIRVGVGEEVPSEPSVLVFQQGC